MDRFSAIALFFLMTPAVFAAERTFTDDQGRQIQAELVGFRGDRVVLKKNGRLAQWPVNKLSAGDQAYVSLWKKSVRGAPPIQVRVWERDGIGEKGVVNSGRLSPAPGKNIPLLKQTEEKAYYKHYDVDLHNNSPVDAGNLVMAYVLYVITPQRQVIAEHASESVPRIAAGGRETVKTQGVTYVRSKVTSATFSTNILGNLQVGSDTSRSREKFGGAWVRVYGADGEMVGEDRDIVPELEKLNPQWVGEDRAPRLPVAISFEQLEEFLAPLRELIESLPAPPPGIPGPAESGKGKGKGPPGLPPFPPR